MQSYTPMMLNATRTACVVGAGLLLAAAGCGQDLDLGPLTGRDGLTLPPPAADPSPRCVVNDPAALRPPKRCFPVTDISTTKTNDGPTFTWTFTTESCVVSGDGNVYGPAGHYPTQYAACPIGIYWKFAPRPFHQPALAPLFPPDPSYPDAGAFERSIAVYRQTDPENSIPEQWQQPFVSPGWETVPRNVQVLPEQEAVFVTLDPRSGRNEKFWVMLAFRDLYPSAERSLSPPRSEPLGLGLNLNVAAGTGQVVEKRIEARAGFGLEARFRDTAAARP
jgi:hypothetical protein